MRMPRCYATVCMLVTIAIASDALFAAQQNEAVPPGVESAIDRGLYFLTRQQKANGSFGADGAPNAVAGLSLLALLSGGHMPEVGKYGLPVRNALEFLLKQEAEDGYFGGDGGGMRSHAVVSLALAEVYGTEGDARLRERVRSALEKAIRVLYAAQDVAKPLDDAGGWGSAPASQGSDLIITAWCVLALRGCENAGLAVPKPRIEQASAYVRRRFRAETGGFAEKPGGEPTVGATAAGALILPLLDDSDQERVAPAAEFLLKHFTAPDDARRFQSIYLVTLAADQVGGTTWAAIWKKSSERLLSKQAQDGGWDAKPEEMAGQSGRSYATALACLTLSIPLRLLPMK